MKKTRTYAICALFAFAIFAACTSNEHSTNESEVPDTANSSIVADSPQAQQPNGYAPSNAKGQNDSTKTTDSAK